MRRRQKREVMSGFPIKTVFFCPRILIDCESCLVLWGGQGEEIDSRGGKGRLLSITKKGGHRILRHKPYGSTKTAKVLA